MASTMDIYPHYDENEENYYSQEYYKTIYKDKNDENGYIIEFTNVEKDKKMTVGMDDIIYFSDRYKIGEEMSICK